MGLKSWRIYKKQQQFSPGVLGLINNPFFAARRGLFTAIKVLAAHLSGKVLDVGCGQKPYAELFANTEYIGMEIDTEENRQNKRADQFYDGHTFPFVSNTFEGVICNQVFEHVFNPQEFMAEICRVLKPGGILLLTVPFVWDEHEQPWDYARYTSNGISHILEQNNFEIIEQRKSTTGIKAIFQLINAYLYKITRAKIAFFRLKHIGMLLFPFVNIAGEVASILLPDNQDIYLDNVILARKTSHE
jgi:SAM-dependent methyltransferase